MAEEILDSLAPEEAHIYYEMVSHYDPFEVIEGYRRNLNGLKYDTSTFESCDVMVRGEIRSLLESTNGVVIIGGHFIFTDNACEQLSQTLSSLTGLKSAIEMGFAKQEFSTVELIHQYLEQIIFDVNSWPFLKYTHYDKNHIQVIHHQDPKELLIVLYQIAFSLAMKLVNPNLLIIPSGGRNRANQNLMSEGMTYKLIALWMITHPRFISAVNSKYFEIDPILFINQIIPETAAASTKLNVVCSMILCKEFFQYPSNIGFITYKMKLDRVSSIMNELRLHRAVLIGMGEHEDPNSKAGERLEGAHTGNLILQRITSHEINIAILEEYSRIGVLERALLMQLVYHGNLHDYNIPLPWEFKGSEHELKRFEQQLQHYPPNNFLS